MELLIFHSIFNLNKNKKRDKSFSSILVHILQRDEVVHAPSSASSSWSDSPLHPFFFVSSFPGIPRQRRCLSHISNYGRLQHSFPSFLLVDEQTVKEHFISFPLVLSHINGAHIINTKYPTVTLNYFKLLRPVHSLQILNCP